MAGECTAMEVRGGRELRGGTSERPGIYLRQPPVQVLGQVVAGNRVDGWGTGEKGMMTDKGKEFIEVNLLPLLDIREKSLVLSGRLSAGGLDAHGAELVPAVFRFAPNNGDCGENARFPAGCTD